MYPGGSDQNRRGPKTRRAVGGGVRRGSKSVFVGFTHSDRPPPVPPQELGVEPIRVGSGS